MAHRPVCWFTLLLTLVLSSTLVAEQGTRKPKEKGKGQNLKALAASIGEGAAEPVRMVMVPMRDGVKLATDLIVPKGEGKWPVLLMRTPYGRNNESGMTMAGGIVAKLGFAVVSQDMRGRGDSEGSDFPVFASDGWYELQDGYDTIEWIAKQPWCNGKIGQFGASALGITANATAPSRPPHLACQFVAVAASDVYMQGATFNGTPRKALTEGWIYGTKLDPNNITLWREHPNYDDFWKKYCPERVVDRVNIPVCYVGGWYDIFTQGTIDSFVAVQHKGDVGARGKCRLIMGPWAHGDSNGLQYPPNSNMMLQASELLSWYNKWCKGIDLEPNKPPVKYYTMGAVGEPNAPGNVWRTAADWPPPSTTSTYYFHEGNGLSVDEPKEQQASATYTYDPNNPVPTQGGGNLKLKKGSMDQSDVENRKDVILFTTPVLTEPVEATGRIRVKLWANSDCKDTDFTAKLCDVYPDGRSMLVLDGVISARYRESPSEVKLIEPGKVYAFDIDLWSTSIIFNRGHRIRVAISSSNYPRFEANPNTGKPRVEPGSEGRVARNTIYFDKTRPSHIVLPRVIQAASAGH